jgi:hypothetical protein
MVRYVRRKVQDLLAAAATLGDFFGFTALG